MSESTVRFLVKEIGRAYVKKYKSQLQVKALSETNDLNYQKTIELENKKHDLIQEIDKLQCQLLEAKKNLHEAQCQLICKDNLLEDKNKLIEDLQLKLLHREKQPSKSKQALRRQTILPKRM